MECPSCAFQNTPGMRSCVRCQSLLDLSSVVIDPPRAGGSAVARRGRDLAFRARLGARTRLGRMGRGIADGLHLQGAAPLFPWGVLPGLPHWRAGSGALGKALFACWLGLLVLSVATIGSGLSLLLVAIALSVHCLAITLFLSQAMQEMPIFRRVAAGLGIYAALLLGLYLPARMVFTGCVGVIRLQAHVSSDFLQGRDVLLRTGRWTRPEVWERGTVVVFAMPRQGIAGAVVHSGHMVDRLLAMPGDWFEVRDGVVLVNGMPVAEGQGPLFDHIGIPNFTLVLGPGEYVVIPSGLHVLNLGGGEAAARGAIPALSRVQEEQLVGRVIWRLRPWLRTGPI